MTSERCDHSVRDTAMSGAIGFGFLAAGFGPLWAVAGMVAGGLLGWWLARRWAAQEGRDGE